MANGFIYIRDTEKVSVALPGGGSSVIGNKLNLPFINSSALPKVPVIDVGTYYDNADNAIYNSAPVLLNSYNEDDCGYDATIDSLEYSVIFVPINDEETEFAMILLGK